MQRRRRGLTTNAGQPRIEAEAPEQTIPFGIERIQMMEELAHLNRERIPERIVHAKGSGAYGSFEALTDCSRFTRANFLSRAGKRTEIFVRFSTTSGEKGSADSERDFRGFSIKFYTEEGNYDLVGSSSPVFFIRDPRKFPALVHSQKRHPETGLRDPEMFWDFLSLSPESLHQVTILFSDRGIPQNYRRMNGYGTHSYLWYTAEGERFWVKYHLRPEAGFASATNAEAHELRASDPDAFSRDLFEAIAAADFPAWTLSVQIVPERDAERCSIDLFDPTQVLPLGDFPRIPIGRLVLNRLPRNYFAEIEQAAFAPSNFVPGIGPSPDPLLQARLFSYSDAQRYRLGTNHHLIRVNKARAARVFNHQRDGFMRTDDNFGAALHYAPSSAAAAEMPSTSPLVHMVPPHARAVHDDFSQAGVLFRKVLSGPERERLIRNLATHLAPVPVHIQHRQAALCYRADEGYGTKLSIALDLEVEEVARLAELTPEERREATSPRAWKARTAELCAPLPHAG